MPSNNKNNTGAAVAHNNNDDGYGNAATLPADAAGATSATITMDGVSVVDSSNKSSNANITEQDDDPNRSYSWFRTEPMSLCQMYLQTESAYSILAQLGQKSICHFRDLNPNVNAFQRKFVPELRRCIEMERKLAYFEKEIQRDDIPVIEQGEEPPAPSLRDIIKLEQQIDSLETELIRVNNTRLNLKRRLLELTELRSILKYTDQFLAEATTDTGPEANKKMLRRMSVVDPMLMRRFSTQIGANPMDVNIPLDPVIDMYTLTGTILATRFPSFERLLWRVTRGNCLLKKFNIDEKLEDPQTGEMQTKCLFILVFQGEKLRQNCTKICEGYHTNLYPCPEKADERQKMFAGVISQINDMMVVIEQSDEHRSHILVAVANNLRQWKISVAKMRSIFEILNCFLITEHSLIGECWIPRNRISDARTALIAGQTLSNTTVPSALSTMTTGETPPTLNVTNKFTNGFQALIDSYGVSSYQEVNPAPFSIITFSFLFAVMFGDTGHGLIMTLLAAWICWKERQLASIKDEIFSMFYMGRYIILLMGIFSMYTGMIYNDVFSKSVNMFGSQWSRPPPPPNDCNGKECYLEPIYDLVPADTSNRDYVYYFGIDPVWQLSVNKVTYLNSYKMKLSVILGVIHMLGGVALSIFNHVHFRHWVSVWFEFIPQLIFLLAIFGYMNFMIIYKWFMYDDKNSGCAPSVLITLINMFMFKQGGPNDPCYLRDPMYTGQNTVQVVLLVAAVVCIPAMLCVKPIWNHKIKKRFSGKELFNHSTTGESIELQLHKPMTIDDVIVENSGDNDNKQKANGGGGGGDRKQSRSSDTSSSDSSDNSSVHNHKNSIDDSHGGHGGGGDPHEPDNFSDAFITQIIHTIEYCLGCVSHTASYLRLWALSLAHAELSEVLWQMVMSNGFMEFHDGPPNAMNIASAVVMFFIFGAWAGLTMAILIIMEGLSAFLHALRLHWVEFMSKFYVGSGYPFVPFSFKRIISEL